MMQQYFEDFEDRQEEEGVLGVDYDYCQDCGSMAFYYEYGHVPPSWDDPGGCMVETVCTNLECPNSKRTCW